MLYTSELWWPFFATMTCLPSQSKHQHLAEDTRGPEKHWWHCGKAPEAATFTQVVHSSQQKLINSDVCWIWAGWKLTQSVTAVMRFYPLWLLNTFR